MNANPYGLIKDWRDDLRAGDVLVSPSGDYRVVRKVTMRKSGFIWGVSLAIRRRSWTNRPYTVMTRTDIQQRGFQLSHAKYRFKAGTIDVELYRDIVDHFRQRLHACDVIGVVS